jgi:hypothetical protein
MHNDPEQHEVRYQKSRHPSKYRSKRRAGRLTQSEPSSPQSGSFDVGDGPWGNPRGSTHEYTGPRVSPSLGRPSAPADLDDLAARLRSMAMSMDGASDEVTTALSPDALYSRARMMADGPPGSEAETSLPKGRTCIITNQYPEQGIVRVSGLKGGEKFELETRATNLKVLPQTRENTVKFPCVVIAKEAYQPSTSRNPENRILYLEAGDQGFIDDVDGVLWLARVIIPTKRDYTGKTVNAWIKLDNLKIGPRKYGRFKVYFRVNAPNTTFTVVGTSTPSQYPLAKYFFDLYTGFMDHAGLLGLPEYCINDMRLPQERYTISHQLAEAIHRAGLTNIYGAQACKDFTLRQIRDTATPVTEDMVARGGVYGRRLTDFKKGCGRSPGDVLYYTGKASLFGPRKKGYNNQPFNPNDLSYNGTHYTATRDANRREMFIVMDIDINHPNFLNMITYGEQAMVCLLQTWRSNVLNSVIDLPAGTSLQTAIGAVSALGGTKTDAAIMHSISVQAATLNRFPGGVLRPSFGVDDGLNYNAPLLESKGYDKVAIVKIDAGDRYVFFRGPVKLLDTDNYVWHLRRESPTGEFTTYDIDISAEDRRRIPTGADIYPSWEMMKNGVAHPVPRFRLPKITAWTGADEIKTLAFKISWREPRSWKQMYMQVKFHPRALNDNRGTMSSYNDGFNMLHYLKREIVDPPSTWMHRIPTARILVPHFDHLTQSIRMDYESGRIRQVPDATLKPIPTLVTEMQAIGLENVGVAHGHTLPRPPGTRGGRERKSCDNCHNRDQMFRKNFLSDAIKQVSFSLFY